MINICVWLIRVVFVCNDKFKSILWGLRSGRTNTLYIFKRISRYGRFKNNMSSKYFENLTEKIDKYIYIYISFIDSRRLRVKRGVWCSQCLHYSKATVAAMRAHGVSVFNEYCWICGYFSSLMWFIGTLWDIKSLATPWESNTIVTHAMPFISICALFVIHGHVLYSMNLLSGNFLNIL